MAPTPFEGAFGSFGLLAKTTAALEASCDESWCRQTTSELRLLEAVLSQVKDISPTTASEETIRIVGLCGLPWAPHMQHFLQELKKLQPDLDRYFEDGEDRPDAGGPPLWAATVQRNTSTLMMTIGVKLRLTNIILRVLSLLKHTTSGELQRAPKIPPDPLSLTPATPTPSQQCVMNGNGNFYQGVHVNDGAKAHLGNNYSYLGVPKASVDKLFEKLNSLATTDQAHTLMLLLQEMRKKQTFTRPPSMLLDSNIRIIDALNRELSLPYQHFRHWPVMLARLQCEFKGLPGESHISETKFGLFRAAKRPQDQVMISFDQWEHSVFPGDQLLMSIDVEQLDPNECPSCGCALREMSLNPVFSECTACGQLVHTVRNDLTDKVLRASVAHGPDEQHHTSKKPVEVMDIQRFARVHGRHREQSSRKRTTLDLIKKYGGTLLLVDALDESPTIPEDNHTSDSSSLTEASISIFAWLNNPPAVDDKITRWINGTL